MTAESMVGSALDGSCTVEIFRSVRVNIVPAVQECPVAVRLALRGVLGLYALNA
jgi:hypothetical protein